MAKHINKSCNSKVFPLCLFITIIYHVSRWTEFLPIKFLNGVIIIESDKVYFNLYNTNLLLYLKIHIIKIIFGCKNKISFFVTNNSFQLQINIKETRNFTLSFSVTSTSSVFMFINPNLLWFFPWISIYRKWQTKIFYQLFLYCKSVFQHNIQSHIFSAKFVFLI